MPKKFKKEEGIPRFPAVIAGGRIIDPASGTDKTGDIYIENGKIARLEFSKLLIDSAVGIGVTLLFEACGELFHRQVRTEGEDRHQ